jgi:hypothetical protein
MKTKELFREIFILAVRLLGLVMIYRGVRVLTAFEPFRAGADFIGAVIYFVAAFVLIRGTIVHWAYPEAVTPESKAEDVGSASPQKADA